MPDAFMPPADVDDATPAAIETPAVIDPHEGRDDMLAEMAKARAITPDDTTDELPPGESAPAQKLQAPAKVAAKPAEPSAAPAVDEAVERALAARAKENEDREAWRTKERERLASEVKATAASEREAMKASLRRELLEEFRAKPGEFVSGAGADPKALVLDLAEHGTPEAATRRAIAEAVAQAKAAEARAAAVERAWADKLAAEGEAQKTQAAAQSKAQEEGTARAFVAHVAKPETWPTIARLSKSPKFAEAMVHEANAVAERLSKERGGQVVQWDEVAAELEATYGNGKAAQGQRAATPTNGGKGARHGLTQADASRRLTRPDPDRSAEDERAAMLAEMAAERKRLAATD